MGLKGLDYAEMAKKDKSYWTSCPVDKKTDFSKFTRQFQIISDNTPSPTSFPPLIFFNSWSFYQLCVIMDIDCYS